MERNSILNPTLRPADRDQDESDSLTLSVKRVREPDEARRYPATSKKAKTSAKGCQELCDTCSTIDFRGLLSRKRWQRVGLKQVDLSYEVKQLRQSRCSLCVLISSLLSRRSCDQEVVDCSFSTARQLRGEQLGEPGEVLYRRIKIRSPSFIRTSIYDVLSDLDFDEESKATYIASRRPLPASFEPALINRWINDCNNNHAHGSRMRSPKRLHHLIAQRRFRVVDVFAGNIETLHKFAPYVALSYVWGRAMAHYASTAAPSADMTGDLSSSPSRKHIDWQRLPRTVREVRNVLRAIGERYLWIDSLCIDQHDPEDKRIVIAQMSAIYECAHLTLIAATGEGAEAGVLGFERSPETRTEFYFQGHSVSLLPDQVTLSTALSNCKWSTRAWTYQERLLSQRCVVFTEQQAYFSCPDIICSETYIVQEIRRPLKSGVPNRNSRQNILARRLMQDAVPDYIDYVHMIQDYTKLSLTHQGDRLDAVLGILNKFYADVQEPATLCGMPTTGFVDALFWVFATSDASVTVERLKCDATGSRRFPSWS